ncbi:DNA-binding transcriptional regulator, MarR family [Desulfocicer vacuolatum DSM 3385]|uniref:DNA-binding transcriptional regulator, MarR family n=1 Tax=Desulfocicer vacuolatum DSM 3385 TaxID=1121400 RepID=A0A1W1YSE6_9BACT|nr:MarR family transcriptional regulator [Desulfocicer vacuolatum]SMC39043.1 DNA-binding transcriptional regulator, MarR family [Desulfocicer vacuolatum DSM 3385]
MIQVKKDTEESRGQVVHDLFKEVFLLHGVLSAITDTVHEQAGLGTPQRRIMHVLDRHGPTTIPHIASRLGVSRQFIRTVCNKMIAEGFLESGENPFHKKSMLIRMSESGAVRFQQAEEKEHRIIEQALPGIDLKEASRAVQLLKRIRGQIGSVDLATFPWSQSEDFENPEERY